MDPIEISGYAGLTAIGLLTANILVGLLMATKYNPVRHWPHKRIDVVTVHNWTGWAALLTVLVHPAILLFPNRVEFHLIDLFFPLNAPKQPWFIMFGAAAAYLLVIVVITSYFRFEIGRKWWKRIHFATYALFPCFAFHSIFMDPLLKDRPIDFIDGEKVYVELCVLAVVVAIAARIRWQRRQGPARVHRAKSQRA